MKRVFLYVALIAALVSFASVKDASANPGAGKGKDAKSGGPAAKRSQPDIIAGKVTETLSSGGYTYVLLEKGEEKVWVAAPTFKAVVGAQMVFPYGNVITEFTSKTLNRTFKNIMFTNGPIALPGATGGKGTAPKPKEGTPAKAGEKIKVDKAAGSNAYTVAELFAGIAKLQGKEVSVRGKVVKVTEGIMKTNWLHLQDGTGSLEKGDNDLVVTSDDLPVAGDTVTVTGKLLKDKDFGYGYKYAVIVEKASIKK